MMLVRVSGHSGAGKSRLTRAFRAVGISVPRAVIATSRLPREGERHGFDYYFLPRSVIASLPETDFFVGEVRTMLQAVDLAQLQKDLELSKTGLVLIEIYHKLWPDLVGRIEARVGDRLRTASVFMTAISPDELRNLPDDASRAEQIRSEVAKILRWRGKDSDGEIQKRSEDAVNEILEAIRSDGGYSQIFWSSPEGPDHEDDWTREEKPVGRAKQVIEDFGSFVMELENPRGAVPPRT
jgi:guanylate kinase